MKIKRFIGGSLESNCYIISNKTCGHCFIIDPGYEPQRIISYIEKMEFTVQGIILTHHHHDHVGGAERIRNYFDCPVMMHYVDSLIYKGRVDVELEDGQILDLDGEELKIFHTPGHTGGCICIMSEKSKVVFTGDTIFDTDLGRTDLEDSNPADMIISCRDVINKWNNEFTIYPGHDGSASMKQVRIYNEEFLSCLK